MYIKLERVGLKFPIYDNQNDNIRNFVLKNLRNEIKKSINSREIITLKNINLSLKSGDRVALYGSNGSGKTSLLKVISGIYRTTGKIEVNGNIFPLLSIDTGLNLDATGYENIYLILYTKNLNKEEINKKIEDNKFFRIR